MNPFKNFWLSCSKMKEAHKPVLMITGQIRQLAEMLGDAVWTVPVEVLSGATTGQHVRHIFGLFQQLQQGYDTGVVNYDNRVRHTTSETSVAAALAELEEVEAGLKSENKTLLLQYHNPAGDVEVSTNYARELHYCLEHAIHHLAIVKSGLRAIGIEGVPADLGVAFSTLAYRNVTASAS